MRKQFKVLLQGGLGNQLWQLAYAHYLANSLGEDVCVKVRQGDGQRQDEIHEIVNHCSHLSFEFYTDFGMKRKLENKVLFNSTSGLPRFGYYESKSQNEVPKTSSLNSSNILGFFQNVSLIESTAIQQVKSEILQWMSQISLSHSALEYIGKPSVHIRRGDYKADIHRQTIGLLNQRYFVSAMNELDVHKAVIFSDVTQRSELDHFNRHEIVTKQMLRLSEVFILLSSATKLIISNSSFSWWAYFLNDDARNSGNVCIPFPWFKGLDHSITDFYCGGRIQDSIFE